jgi:DNA-directed RNA polymerase subunit M/transcription elongation factor TFIIS
MEKGGRMGSVDEPLRKIVYCGYCNTAMKLRTRKGARKYVCQNCKQEKEEAWIMKKAIGQTKHDLKWMLNTIAIRLGISNMLQKSKQLKNRIDIVLCNYEKIEAGDSRELVRMLKNYVPFESSKKLLVYSDRVIVQGMSKDEVMTELELGETDWLAYAYRGKENICS